MSRAALIAQAKRAAFEAARNGEFSSELLTGQAGDPSDLLRGAGFSQVTYDPKTCTASASWTAPGAGTDIEHSLCVLATGMKNLIDETWRHEATVAMHAAFAKSSLRNPVYVRTGKHEPDSGFKDVLVGLMRSCGYQFTTTRHDTGSYEEYNGVICWTSKPSTTYEFKPCTEAQ